ncbi:MAG: YihY/virulence factor BrkB family protein [Actinomycetota bacterium]|nr:YihY/virulence factor BrkB family protein [Actinomycetota bacterium]
MTEHLIPEAPPEIPLPREDAAGPGPEVQRVLRAPDAIALGRLANSPREIPWRGWRAVIRRTIWEMLTDRVSLVAAGCAFYGTLALFPAMSMLVSIYGLIYDPATVEPQLALVRDLLPPSAYVLISDRVHMLVTRPPGTLGIGLLVSTAVALWSSASGIKSIITALNLAYEEREQRSFLRYQLTAFTITILAILSAVVGLVVLVGLPAGLAFFGVPASQTFWVRISSFGLLLLGVLVGLSLLYRFGPCRISAKWHWITPGSMVATVLWIAASALFSWYVQTFSTYDATYGPLGTVVAFMMWLFVTVYVVLLGAELNAELELQTVRDSTRGAPKPFGRRGAYVADHVAED